MIHSLYGNKEIFLRELVSNASDACDKLRFEAMADGALFENDPDLKIRVSYDTAARTITVSDNGIGMSRQEVIDHIGTIAKSGTREFFAAPDRRPRQGRAPHRPVRRRLLLRRSSWPTGSTLVDAARRARPPSTACGGRAPAKGDYTHRDRRQGGARHRRHPAPAAGGGRAALGLPRCATILRKYSDHITVPILMKKEQWDATAKAQVADRRGRAGQPGVGALGAAEVGDHRGAVPRVLQARRARLRAAAGLQRTRRSRAARSTRSCSSSRSARRSTCGTATTATASSCTSGASSSWTTPSS